MAVVGAGDSFGKYRILSLLGRGGAGAVYVAEDETLGRRVALKVLDRALTRMGRFEELLRREARLIASIEHPHIVRIHSLEHVGGDLAIDMAYMRGGSLVDVFSRGAMPPQSAVVSSLEILSALASCHASGLIHRDVKPANILRDETDRSLLSDFGLAKLLSVHHADSITASTSADFFVGTPRYAPPEAWDGVEPTPAWDVYSVGMVLYEAIAGQTPYDARAPMAYMKQLMERPVLRLDEHTPGVSCELSDAVAIMLAHEPEARPKDAGEALELLRATPEFSQVQDRDVITSHGYRLRTRRALRIGRGFPRHLLARKGSLVLGAVAGVLLAAAAAIYAVMGEAPPSATAGGDGRVFDTLDIASGATWPGYMLSTPGEAPGEQFWVASNDTRLWYLRSKPGDDGAVLYEGHWAGYGDASARVFRHGTVSGTGRMDPDGREALSLQFVSLQDGSRWGRSLLKSPSNSGNAADYLRKLRQGDYVQPLVYDELVPRRLAWAEQLEKAYLCSPEGRVSVPSLASGTVLLDGSLDEPAWGDTATGAPGNVVCGSDPASRLMLRHDGEALYIGLRCERLAKGAQVGLALLNRFSIPFGASPQWRARFDGPALVESTCASDESTIPWECTWKAAASQGQMEFHVSFASVGAEQGPAAEERWRLSCRIVDDSDRTLAAWGDGADRADMGMVLVFAPPRS